MALHTTFHVENETALSSVAASLATILPAGALVALEGNLGAGKTALARALIRHMCHDPALDVPSPTYTLAQTYECDAGPIWHFDMYRLKTPDEAYEIGWEEALAEAHLILLEWPSRIAPLLPPDMLRIIITPLADSTRKIELIGLNNNLPLPAGEGRGEGEITS